MALQAVDSYDKLFLKCDGTTTTFTDSSLSPKTVTANGTATQLPSKFNKSAAFFNGTSDRIDIPDHADWDFGTGAFTLEGWYFFNSVPTQPSLLSVGGGTAGVHITYYSGNLHVYVANVAKTFAWTPSTGTWYHVAFVRDGSNNLYAFINGTQIGSTLSSSANITGTTAGVQLGNETVVGVNYFSGWMKEIRISNTARYTANFTPNTGQATADSNTKLLLHCDTPADCPIGPAIYLDGTGDYLSLADHADWDSGASGSFTYEAFVQFKVTTAQRIFSRDDGASGNGLSLHYDGAGQILGYVATSNVAGSWTPVINKWYHIALVRNSSTVKVYVDGVEKATGTISTAMSYSTALYIGQMFNSTQLLNGYLREVRVSDVARYTSAFTPSQSGFTVDSNTKLYIKGNESNGVTTFVDSETSAKTVTTNGDAKIKYIEDYRSCIFKDDGNTGHKPYPVSTAKIDFFCLGSSVASFTDATSSYLSIPDSDDWYFNADFTQEAYIRLPVLNVSTYFFGQSTDSLNATVLWYEQSTPYLGYRDYVANSNVLAFQADPKFIVNTWFHIALTRSGNDFTIWVNGTSIATANQSVTYSNVNGNFYVGADNAVTWSFAGQKLMDNIRISKGTARYTSTFNPPFEPASSSTSSGAGVSAISTFLMIF